MGTIIKFILIFLIVSYLIRKVGGFFVRLFFGGNNPQYNQSRYGGFNSQQQNQHYNNEPGKVKVKKAPKHNPNEAHISGGEYVDFEEVE